MTLAVNYSAVSSTHIYTLRIDGRHTAMQTTDAIAVKGIDVSTYLVKDPERAKAFYKDVMGFTPTMEYGGNGAEYTFADGATFGLWKMDDGSWNACHGVMFSVDDARAAADHYRSKGAKIGDYIHEGDNCVMAFGEDSEGNTFIIHQRK